MSDEQRGFAQDRAAVGDGVADADAGARSGPGFLPAGENQPGAGQSAGLPLTVAPNPRNVPVDEADPAEATGDHRRDQTRPEARRPPRGILKYDDRAFEIEYTPELRARVLATLDAMRSDLRSEEVDRSHQEAGRCRGCGQRTACDRRLA